MTENKTHKYVDVMSYTGMDWHDMRGQEEFLRSPDGSYQICNPGSAIAAHIHRELTAMESNHVGLKNIPGTDRLHRIVAGGQPLHLESPDGQLYADWNPENSRLTLGWCYGQVTSTIHYDTVEIADRDVLWIPVENFLSVAKAVPSVQRLRHAPFANQAEAEAFLEGMGLHPQALCLNGSVKELLVLDRSQIQGREWYLLNMKVLEILDAHPELDVPDNFAIDVRTHLERLEEALKGKAS